MFIRLFLICSLILLRNFTFASDENSYSITNAKKVQRIDTVCSVYIDPSDSLTLQDVSAEAFDHRFIKNKSNLRFGYLKETIWIKIKIRNTSDRDTWFLEIPAPFLEYIDFYQKSSTRSWTHSQAGYYRHFSLREVSHTGHVLPLRFDGKSETTVLIKLSGRSPKTFPLLIVEEEYFHEKVRQEDIGYGILFGFLIVMFFYNFFIYLSLRNTNYLLYICTIVCTFLIFSSASGYAGKFLWPDNPMLNFFAGRLSLPLQGVFMSLFTIKFLELRMYSKPMFYVVLSILPLSVIAAILLTTGILSSAGNNLISIATVLYMISGIVCAIRGNKTAYYFISAWTLYLIGGLMLTLRNSGILDFNFWTTHFVEIGAALETVIIAFALADKYRRLRKEKEAAQNLALKIQQEATERLEGKVRDRTERLSKANFELQQTLEKNLQQTRTIEDKNAELDSFFYRISHDLKGPISSLRGLSQLAKMEVTEPVALEYFERQHQQVERLNHIINGLINLTKLNNSDIQREQINFATLVDDCIQSFHALPKYNQISFLKEIDTQIVFISQWTLINAIVQNLIENSIKYSQPGSPFVRIRVNNHSDHITIQVEDNGEGIEKNHQPKIFDMFFRAAENAPGTGLGLYILKRSLDRLNGKIEVMSEKGRGSIFTVRLPKEN